MKQKELIQLLKSHAKRARLTQEDVARGVGVRLITVNRWFNGHYTKMHLATENSIRAFLTKVGALG